MAWGRMADGLWLAPRSSRSSHLTSEQGDARSRLLDISRPWDGGSWVAVLTCPNHSCVGVAEISDSDDDVIFQVGLGSVGHPNKLDGRTMIRDSN